MSKQVEVNGVVYAVITTEDIPMNVTCKCGTPLVRNGVTVTEHWIGDRCDPCDRKARQEFLNSLSD
jgi:hypothetical protein